MKKKFLNFSVQDSKDDDGLWVSNYCVTTPEAYQLYHSRSALLWQQVLKRTDANGYYQKKKPSYLGSTNSFSNFQEFAEWCNSQELYCNGTEGIQLDKDILVVGNKDYHPEKCCFVPNVINNLFKDSNKKRGNCLLGVYWREKYRVFVSQCNDIDGRRRFLGHYSSEMEAHRAWQKFKITTIRAQAERYAALPGSRTDVCSAIVLRADIIEQDLLDGKETLRIF